MSAIQKVQTPRGPKYRVRYTVREADGSPCVPPKRRTLLFATEDEACAFLADVLAQARQTQAVVVELERFYRLIARIPHQTLRRDLQGVLGNLTALLTAPAAPTRREQQRAGAARRGRARLHVQRQGFAARERLRLIEHYQMVCQYCGRASSSCADDPDGEAWQIDHIVPLARGGSHRRSNWTLSCRACNAAKKAKLLEEWQPTQASEQA